MVGRLGYREGMALIEDALDDFKAIEKQSGQNFPGARVAGARVHHGFLGLCLAGIGAMTGYKGALGMGVALCADDVNDIMDWLNFKK